MFIKAMYGDSTITPYQLAKDKLYINKNIENIRTYEGQILPSPKTWQSVTYGNGKFVAVASYTTTAAYSIDGINWTAATLPANPRWQFVTYGAGKFVVVGQSSTIAAYSTDGINWTAATLPASVDWCSVTYGNDKFVAVASYSNTVAYSTDGINWNTTTLPSSTRWNSVIYGAGKFVAIAGAPSSTAAYSMDGINWTTTALPAYIAWYSVTYGAGKFVTVASGPSTTAAYSTDGINWIAATLPANIYWQSVTYGAGKFVAVALSFTAAYSTDGINWTATTLSSSTEAWNSVIYGDGKFVAVDAQSSKFATISFGDTITSSSVNQQITLSTQAKVIESNLALIDDNAMSVTLNTGGKYSDKDIKVIGVRGFKYGFRITRNTILGEHRVEYLYDCVNYIPAGCFGNINNGNFTLGSWKKFLDWENFPVILNENGRVIAYINPQDLDYDIDGNPSYIYTENNNAMSCFRRLYTYEYQDEYYQYVILSNVKINNNFKPLGFENGNESGAKYAYCGMYFGSIPDGSDYIQSLSNKEPLDNQQMTPYDASAFAMNNKSGWSLLNKTLWDFINNLLILISKTTDLVRAFGPGYLAPIATSKARTGHLNYNSNTDINKQFYYNQNPYGTRVFYIEDYWGNLLTPLLGWYASDGERYLVKKGPPYVPIGSTDSEYSRAGYIDVGDVSYSLDDNSTQVCDRTEYGYIPVSNIEGNTNTYSGYEYGCCSISGVTSNAIIFGTAYASGNYKYPELGPLHLISVVGHIPVQVDTYLCGFRVMYIPPA